MYHEMILVVARQVAEPLSDALLAEGALSVQAEDADADTTDEVPIFAEPGEPVPDSAWQRTRLVAMLSAEQLPQAAHLLREACDLIDLQTLPTFELRPLPDQDWVSLTQSQFEPIDIGPRLRIRPTWHSTSASAQNEVILDPGLAFGTGSHPTTKMCLQWIEACMPPGLEVIDYGCGSGILAIAAAKLGAAKVWGVEIDEQAVLSTRQNATLNQVQVHAFSTREHKLQAAPIVIANILANPLKVLAPMLEQLVLPGGHLILAGLLDRQVEEVSAVYHRVDLKVFRSLEGWSCLVGQAKP